MKPLVVSALILGAIAAPHFAAAEAVTIAHAKGELTLQAVPQKVAIFDLASLDIIDALGIEAVAGVPKGEDGAFNAPAFLSQYSDAKYAGVGTLFEPDLAALAAMQPDLIVIAGRSAAKYDVLKDIAPTIDMTSGQSDLVAAAEKNVKKIGQIFAVEALAEAKIAEMKEAVAKMRDAAPKDEKAIVLFTIGENIMPHAPGARFGNVYDYVGLASVMEPFVAPPKSDEPAPQRPEPGSPEAIAAQKKREAARDAELAKAPDWIITLDRGAISSDKPSDVNERLGKVETVAATPAWKEGKVINLDPRGWYLVGAGVQNLTQTAQEITSLFTAKQ